MIIKEEFLSRIRKIFDLNLYEAKVWTALLSRGVSTAGELSNISDVPRSRTYDILESLEKKGFIIMKLGKPIKFVALKPEEVVERVKKNLIVYAQEKTKKLDMLMPSLDKCRKRGVKIRIAAPIDKNNLKVAKELKRVAEVRNMTNLKARFVIIDGNQLMFMLLDDEKFHPNYDIGVWINTDFFASALEQMFELAWKEMKTVK